jgi:hypothetical protein
MPGYLGVLPTGSDAVGAVQRPRKGIPDKHPDGHKIYPYLLEGVEVTRINYEWSTDITYIRMAEGFVYLVAGRGARPRGRPGRASRTGSAGSAELGPVAHDGIGLLRGSAQVGIRLRTARDLQQRPGPAVHKREVHWRTGVARRRSRHGWT